MIVGIGTDIVEIKRIEELLDNERFLRKYFTGGELDMYKRRGSKASFLAGNFAVKEAVVKSFGTGFLSCMPADIEVLRNELGKPFVNLSGRAEKISREIGIVNIHVSISNTDSIAIAYVIAEK